MCYYFKDIIKIEDSDICNILLDEKSNETILIYDVLYKILQWFTIRWMALLEIMMELAI